MSSIQLLGVRGSPSALLSVFAEGAFSDAFSGSHTVGKLISVELVTQHSEVELVF